MSVSNSAALRVAPQTPWVSKRCKHWSSCKHPRNIRWCLKITILWNLIQKRQFRWLMRFLSCKMKPSIYSSRSTAQRNKSWKTWLPNPWFLSRHSTCSKTILSGPHFYWETASRSNWKTSPRESALSSWSIWCQPNKEMRLKTPSAFTYHLWKAPYYTSWSSLPSRSNMTALESTRKKRKPNTFSTPACAWFSYQLLEWLRPSA